MAGICRSLHARPAGKAPIGDEDLVAMVGTLGVDLAGLRDHALLCLGWFGAFRRSELVSLDMADVAFTRDGAIVTIRKSKTDQEGQGIEKGIPFAGNPALCPVRALRAWLDAARIEAGPLFRSLSRRGKLGGRLSDKAVARTVKRCAKTVGLDASHLAGHSLRSGFATTAARKGKSLDAIMRQTGHKSERVARGYIRHATLFTDNAAAGLV
jgi:integrase